MRTSRFPERALQELRIIHLHKKSVSAQALATVPVEFVPNAFFLNSCQRLLWICSESSLAEIDLRGEWYERLEILSGVSAYRFLLRVATGLESQVLGETDIFGQLKEAWKVAHRSGELDPAVDFWIQKSFEDTKEIRARYLENHGGGSYGALVRKFLKELGASNEGSTLLVGAGQLGASIAPYLASAESELLIWNRSSDKAQAVADELGAADGSGARVSVLAKKDEELAAWKSAGRIIVCIPGHEIEDLRRIEALKKGGLNRVVLHLGIQRHHAGAWASVPGIFFLDDIFKLQQIQGEARSNQIAQALHACDERAKLRGLGSSVSIHHGWEDLAIFA